MHVQPYILVAEDDPDATFLLRHTLGQAGPGIRVAYTANGKQAIDFLQGKHEAEGTARELPTLFLLDIKMPRMDGFEVLEWLQRYPALRPQCIVVLTASPSPLDIKRAKELGADFYLVKPVGLPELQEIARELIGFCHTGNWSAAFQKSAAHLHSLHRP